jgi:uncharacterized protein (TIGR02246 family)
MSLEKLRSAAFVITGVLLFCVAPHAFAGQSAAGAAAGAAAAVAGSPDADLRDAVRKANTEWAEAMKTGDAAVIAAPYTDGAVFVLTDGKCLQGRADIEQLYRDGFQKGGLASATKIETKSLVRDGDLAYESGYAEVGVVRQGKPVTRGSRYLTVWQAQADGAWKILRNVVLP